MPNVRRTVIPESSQEFYQQEYQNELNEERASEEVGFIGGITHGALGTIARVRALSNDAFGETNQYVPTDDERQQILEAFGYEEEPYRAVVNSLRSKEDIPNAIKVVKENLEYAHMEGQAGFLDTFASSIGDAVADPINWVAGASTVGYGAAGRIIGGTLANVASGQFREKYTGVETDMVMDAVAGLTIGAAFEGMSAGSRKFFAKTYQDSMAVQSNFVAGRAMDSKFFDTTIGRQFKVASSVMRNFFDNHVLSVRIASDFEGVAKGGKLEDLTFKKGMKVEAGRRYEPNGGYQEFGSSKKTAEEYLNEINDEVYRFNQDTEEAYRKMYARGMTDKEIQRETYRMLEGDGGDLPENLKKKAGSDLNYVCKAMATGIERARQRLIAAGKFKVGAIDTGKFFPRALDVNKLADARINIGGSVEEANNVLAARIENNLLEGLKSDPQGYSRMYKSYTLEMQDKAPKDSIAIIPDMDSQEFLDWVKQEAHKTAWGYVDQGRHLEDVWNWRDSKSILPTQHRRPWVTSYVDPATDFCIDDLRVNPKDAYIKYNRRVGGEYIVKEVYGVEGEQGIKDLFDEAIKEELDKAPVGSPDRTNRYKRASEIFIKKLFGEGLRDYDVDLGFGNAMSEVLRNLTFATQNTYMGLLNYTELSAGVLAYGPSLLLKSIPGMSKLITRFSKGGMTKADEQMVLDLLFTREPQIVNIWGDIRRTNRYRYGNHKILADIVSGTQYLANALPTTKFLAASQANIVDTTRGMMLAEMVKRAKGLTGKQRGSFLRKGTLKRLNIDPSDYWHMISKLDKAFDLDGSKISIKDINELVNDPRALTTLRRLGDYAADETILRNHLGDTFNWDSTSSPVINLLMQFKSFAVRSWSKRFIKSAHRVAEGDSIYQAANFSVSIALATLGNLGITALRTTGMSEEDREKYWQMALGVSPDDDIEDMILPMTQASFLRASPLAAPSIFLNALGVGTFAKTTSDARDIDPDEPALINHMNIGQLIAQNMPAVRQAGNYFNLGVDLANLLGMKINPDNYTYEEEQKNVNNLWRSTKRVLPQWGYLTNSPLDFAKDEFTTLE